MQSSPPRILIGTVPAVHNTSALKSMGGTTCEHKAGQLPRVWSHSLDISGHPVLSVLVRCFR